MRTWKTLSRTIFAAAALGAFGMSAYADEFRAVQTPSSAPETGPVGATPTAPWGQMGEFEASEPLERQVQTPSAAPETGPVGATPTTAAEQVGEFRSAEPLDYEVETPSSAPETGPAEE